MEISPCSRTCSFTALLTVLKSVVNPARYGTFLAKCLVSLLKFVEYTLKSRPRIELLDKVGSAVGILEGFAVTGFLDGLKMGSSVGIVVVLSVGTSRLRGCAL